MKSQYIEQIEASEYENNVCEIMIDILNLISIKAPIVIIDHLIARLSYFDLSGRSRGSAYKYFMKIAKEYQYDELVMYCDMKIQKAPFIILSDNKSIYRLLIK